MGYVQQTLGKDEVVRREFPVHWAAYVVPLLLAAFVVGIPLLLSLIFSERCLTSKRVVYKEGFISRRTDEMKLEKIENVQFSQSVMGRILGYGNVEISGTGAGQVTLKKVSSPISVKREIEDHLPNG